MGNAGVEGCCHSILTHSFVGNARAGVKFREASGHSNWSHPLVGNAGVKFRNEVAIPS